MDIGMGRITTMKGSGIKRVLSEVIDSIKSVFTGGTLKLDTKSDSSGKIGKKNNKLKGTDKFKSNKITKDELVDCFQKGLSLSKIAILYKCSVYSIWKLKLKYGIVTVRDGERLFTKAELYGLYVIKKMTVKEISNLKGYSCSTVKRYLGYYNLDGAKDEDTNVVTVKKLQKRQYKKKEFILTDIQKQVLDGALLGNGSLTGEEFYFYNKKEKMVCFIHEYLKDIVVEGCRIRPIHTSDNLYFIRSNSNLCFVNFKNRWYKDGVRVVPSDFILTPLSCLVWFINKGKFYYELGVLGLDITRLDKESVFNVLIPQLKRFEVSIRVNRNSQVITISKIKKFLNYIGECPVTEFAYKWDLNTYKTSNLSENKVSPKVPNLFGIEKGDETNKLDVVNEVVNNDSVEFKKEDVTSTNFDVGNTSKVSGSNDTNSNNGNNGNGGNGGNGKKHLKNNYVCGFCNTGGLTWVYVQDKWRLFYDDGTPHICRTKKELAEFYRDKRNRELEQLELERMEIKKSS